MQDPAMSSRASHGPASSEVVGPAASLRILRVLRRRWWIFVPVWILTLAAGIVALVKVKPLFRPQVILEVRPEMPLVSSDTAEPAVAASFQMWGNYYRTQESLLRSPNLVQAVFKALPPDVSRVLL